jgi:hypothetical protein
MHRLHMQEAQAMVRENGDVQLRGSIVCDPQGARDCVDAFSSMCQALPRDTRPNAIISKVLLSVNAVAAGGGSGGGGGGGRRLLPAAVQVSMFPGGEGLQARESIPRGQILSLDGLRWSNNDETWKPLPLSPGFLSVNDSRSEDERARGVVWQPPPTSSSSSSSAGRSGRAAVGEHAPEYRLHDGVIQLRGTVRCSMDFEGGAETQDNIFQLSSLAGVDSTGNAKGSIMRDDDDCESSSSGAVATWGAGYIFVYTSGGSLLVVDTSSNGLYISCRMYCGHKFSLDTIQWPLYQSKENRAAAFDDNADKFISTQEDDAEPVPSTGKVRTHGWNSIRSYKRVAVASLSLSILSEVHICAPRYNVALALMSCYVATTRGPFGYLQAWQCLLGISIFSDLWWMACPSSCDEMYHDARGYRAARMFSFVCLVANVVLKTTVFQRTTRMYRVSSTGKNGGFQRLDEDSDLRGRDSGSTIAQIRQAFLTHSSYFVPRFSRSDHSAIDMPMRVAAALWLQFVFALSILTLATMILMDLPSTLHRQLSTDYRAGLPPVLLLFVYASMGFLSAGTIFKNVDFNSCVHAFGCLCCCPGYHRSIQKRCSKPIFNIFRF